MVTSHQAAHSYSLPHNHHTQQQQQQQHQLPEDPHSLIPSSNHRLDELFPGMQIIQTI